MWGVGMDTIGDQIRAAHRVQGWAWNDMQHQTDNMLPAIIKPGAITLAERHMLGLLQPTHPAGKNLCVDSLVEPPLAAGYIAWTCHRRDAGQPARPGGGGGYIAPLWAQKG